jgi:hypothetical protein
MTKAARMDLRQYWRIMSTHLIPLSEYQDKYLSFLLSRHVPPTLPADFLFAVSEPSAHPQLHTKIALAQRLDSLPMRR